MEKQLDIFTLYNGQRQTFVSGTAFNKMRVSAFSDVAMNLNVNTLSSLNIFVKSDSFTGNVFDLFGLNCREQLLYFPNSRVSEVYINSLYSFKSPVIENNSSYRYYLEMVVCFASTKQIEVSLINKPTSTLKDVHFELLYDDSMAVQNICHTWKHQKDVPYLSDYSIAKNKECVFALTQGDYNQDCFLPHSSKCMSDMGSFSFGSLCPDNYGNSYGSYGMMLPVAWFGKTKNLSLTSCSLGSSQSITKLYYYEL